MKKIISTLIVMVAVFSMTVAGNGDEALIGKAKGALLSTCQNAGGDLQASVSVVSSCFVDGFVHKVTFYRTPNCPPNTYCIQVIETVGSVTLDCENNVISVSCGAPVLEL